MREVNMNGYELCSIGDNLLSPVNEFKSNQMLDMATKPIGSIDYMYSLGVVDEHYIVLFNHKENTKQDLLLIEGEIKEVRWNHASFMDTTTDSRMWVCVLQLKYDWGNEVHYFIP